MGCDKTGIVADAAIQLQRSRASGFETRCESAFVGVRQELLGRPEGDGGGSGAGALERDLAEVKVFRGEVGVGRVVFIEAANGGIAEENRSATVGLKAVLVGIDDDRVCLQGWRHRRGESSVRG